MSGETRDGPRLLIVTGAQAGDVRELPPPVQSLITGASEILVVSPVLPSRLQWIASDTDRVRQEADERLGTVLGHVEELAPGSETAGALGDETPLSVFTDAVRRFNPDQILVAIRAADHSEWQERHLIDRIREAFPLPLTVLEIDKGGHVTWPAAEHGR